MRGPSQKDVHVGYSWTLRLQRPRDSAPDICIEAASASEQMFFWGAPLAHVVSYEEHLKSRRVEDRLRLAAISARRRGHPVPSLGAQAADAETPRA